MGGFRELSTSTGRSCLSLKPEPAMRRRKLWTRHAGWTLPCTSCAAWGQESSESPVGLRKMGSIIPHAEGFKASAIQQRVLSKHLNGREEAALPRGLSGSVWVSRKEVVALEEQGVQHKLTPTRGLMWALCLLSAQSCHC